MQDNRKYVPLADLTDINPPIFSTHLKPDGMVSFIPMSDVTNTGHWSNQQARRLREVRHSYTPFQEEDILFAKITPCMENGKGAHAVCLINGIGYGSTEFYVLRAKPPNNARFIYHLLQSENLRHSAEAKMTGSAGQKRVPVKFFEEYKILQLHQEEQHCIAQILDTFDTQMQEIERLITKLKQVKAGLLHDLLTRGIDEHGKMRDPVAHPEQFKESPFGLIPREWETSELTCVCTKITDGCHQSVKTSADNIPFLYVSCIRNGQILWDQGAKISEDTYKVISKGREPKKGLLLYTVVGSYGNAAIVENERPFSFQRHIAYILPDSTKVKPIFLVNWLNSSWCHSYADKVALGNAQKTITLSYLKHFPVPLPDCEEQLRIAQALNIHDLRISDEENYLNKLRQIKKGLMHDLLTGNVRVTQLVGIDEQ